MSPEYIYLIVVVAFLAVVAIFAISRYKKVDMSMTLPGGVSGKMSGETEDKPKDEGVPDQPTAPQRASGSSAETTIGGRVSGGTVTTSAKGGQAKTSVGESVEGADILTEA
jgi:hypothetical protein